VTARSWTSALCSCCFLLAASGWAAAGDPPTRDEVARLWSTVTSAGARGDDLGAAEAEQAYATFAGEGRPLYARVAAADALARAGTDRGLRALLERCRRPVRPFPADERLLLASSWAGLRRAPPRPGVLADLYDDARRLRDPWLELNLLRGVCAWDGPDLLRGLARDRREEPLRRATALEALGVEAGDALAEVVPDLLAERLRRVDEAEERLLLGACGSALLAAEDRGPRRETAAAALRDYAARHDLPPATTELVGAYLAARGRTTPRRRSVAIGDLRRVDLRRGRDGWLHDGRTAHGAAAPLPAGARADAGGSRTRTRTRFMGSTTTAERVVFVIDVSDSMLRPLTAAQRRAFARLASDATRTRDAETRWDAARALLIEALEGLPRRVRFAVVAFGDEAFTLPATPKLVRASRSRVRRTIGQLRQIEADRSEFRQGTLGGQTNLYGGLRLAFQLTTGRRLDPGAEHLELDDGAQTLFLFSDGRPNVYPERSEGRAPRCVVPGRPARTTTVRVPLRRGPSRRRVIPGGTREVVVRRNPETGETITRTETYPERVVYEPGEVLEWTERERVIPAEPDRVEELPLRGPEPLEAWRQRDRWRLNAFRHVAIHATLLLEGRGDHAREVLALVRTGPGGLRALR